MTSVHRIMRPDTAMIGASVYERAENDHYPTPENCTRAVANFLTAKKFLTNYSVIWESSCGNGKMVHVLEEEFDKVIATDLFPKMDAPTLDFITTEPAFGFDAIITNPPYSDTDGWMDRCLYYVRNWGTTAAMLMRHEVDSASSRERFFSACPEYAARLTLTWRPRWIEGSTGSPRHNYDWYIWRPGSHDGAKNYYAFRRDCGA